MGNQENMVNDLSEETMEEGALKKGKLIRPMGKRIQVQHFEIIL